MKIFHTADWHLGKIIQGLYMTEDQGYILEQFLEQVKLEQPDVVIIAGDLYDRAVPPTEAVELLNHVLEQLTLVLHIPVLAIAGNHDSPDRLDFAVKLMERNQMFLTGQLRFPLKPIILNDQYGEVHFYLVPYCDPAVVRYELKDDSIRSHDDAMKAIVEHIQADWDAKARHVLIGHAFITPYGEKQENTSESERPLSIGGAEYVNSEYFNDFDYVALGHLHQAHYVSHEKIRYSGSILKYSISEENHQKGYTIVEMDAAGTIQLEKRALLPRREMRRVVGYIEDIERHPVSEDYVYVTLLNENPVLFPMEKIRTVYPNAMHVDRKAKNRVDDEHLDKQTIETPIKQELKPLELFQSFYEEVKGDQLTEDKKQLFASLYEQMMKEGAEQR